MKVSESNVSIQEKDEALQSQPKKKQEGDRSQPKVATDDISRVAENVWHEALESGEPINSDTFGFEGETPLKDFVADKFGFDESADFLEYTASAFPLEEGEGAVDESVDPAASDEDVVVTNAFLRSAFKSQPVDVSKPEDIDSSDEASLFVELDTENGPVTFSGPGAVDAARAFAQTYNNSELFKTSVDDHMAEHRQYNVRTRRDPEIDGVYVTGFVSSESPTTMNLSVPDPTSPEVVQSFEEDGQSYPLEMQSVIVHEFAHHMIHDSAEEHGEHEHEHEDSAFDGQHDSHGRDHTIFIGEVLHELSESGQNVGEPGAVERSDYSDNARIFGQASSFEGFESLDYLDIRSEYSDDYRELADTLNQDPPDYAKAKTLLDSFDKEVSVTSYYENDGETPKANTQTMNLKDVMLQELALEGGRSHIYGEGLEPIKDKSAIGGLFDYLSKGDGESSGEGERLEDVTNAVRVPLSDIPGYSGESSPVDTDSNSVVKPTPEEVTPQEETSEEEVLAVEIPAVKTPAAATAEPMETPRSGDDVSREPREREPREAREPREPREASEPRVRDERDTSRRPRS